MSCYYVPMALQSLLFQISCVGVWAAVKVRWLNSNWSPVPPILTCLSLAKSLHKKKKPSCFRDATSGKSFRCLKNRDKGRHCCKDELFRLIRNFIQVGTCSNFLKVGFQNLQADPPTTPTCEFNWLTFWNQPRCTTCSETRQGEGLRSRTWIGRKPKTLKSFGQPSTKRQLCLLDDGLHENGFWVQVFE